MKASDVEDVSGENVLQRSYSLTSKSLENNLNFLQKFVGKVKPYFGIGSLIVFLLACHGFLIAAGIHNYQKAAPLIYITVFLWGCFILNFLVSMEKFQEFYGVLAEKLDEFAQQKRFVPIGLKIAFILALLAFTIVDSLHDISRLEGFFAYIFYVLFMFVFSNNRMKINWSVVSNALIMHYCIALVILKWSTGQWFFQQVAQLIVGFLEFAQVGAKFVFGFIAGPPNICDLAPVFIFTSLQTLIYFSAVVALMFYFGVIQVVLKKSTWFMRVLIGTTPVESVNAWACTFLGMTEAPLMIAPYFEKLTDSEIFAVVTSGFACVAGTVFAAYVALGACPIYLLTASLLSAPMSLACSKIMFPETEETKIKEEDFELQHGHKKGFFDTLCSAGVAMVPTVFAIGATLLVIMSLLSLLDTVMDYIGDLIGYEGWTFQMLFGYAFFPLAFMMGVTDDVNQTLLVAQLMGTKTAVNEFVAYNNLGLLQKENKLHVRSSVFSNLQILFQPKSVLIATYALCGFSNFSSMGMSIEFLGGFAPAKRATISKLVLRALCAGSIACFMNATVAGILVSSPIICVASQKSDTCFRIPGS
ncbi:hypothetical protein CAEBREN_28139 [Caenorhabditis brenneri]|uniref:Sodium/nucleoside cotransporter n=1 Tax=Caenorhabditis brenneri TaxID=135651 RepID=G0PI45_CAEBE|nr:hypothetical protein CAEBREN_28139 [Caenorhabditis brenneri]